MTTFKPQVPLHRYVMGGAGLPVDHKNGDTLDNRKDNLRRVTCTVNLLNRDKPRKDSQSRFIGVTRHSQPPHRWGAYINKDKIRIGLGWFDTPELANHARLLKEKELFGVQPRRLTAFREAGIEVDVETFLAKG